MSKKNRTDIRGFVYSTDPTFQFEHANESRETLVPQKQKLTIHLDTKHRGGKTVTIVKGFIGSEEDCTLLSKQLKQYCGTGGSAKDAEIIIQGDQRDKILLWLQKKGYSLSKKTGA
ncbi:MAG: translation initiation factor [Bacteroidota bacterium]|jgi:translation initiation factor 1|nr:translation initiation factor [Bacteroidota bacterium]